MATAELETERLRLRPFRPDDLADLQRYAVRPEFYRYLPIPAQTPESVRAFLEMELAQARRGGRYVFAIQLKPAGPVIGSVRVEMRNPANDSGDIGYALDRDHQGRGYATEAVACVLDFGFGFLRLHRIWATADVENTASWRLMARLGMRREGHLRQDTRLRGAWRDSYLYAILADEWRAATPP